MGDIQWERALRADRARYATFLLTGVGTWVGKPAYLTANPMTIQEGRRAIAQAVSDNRVKARGLGHPHMNLPAQQPFQFNTQRTSPPKDMSGDCSPDYPQMPHQPSRGWECNSRRRDQRPQSPKFPSSSPDCGFKRDRSSLSMKSLMSSRSDCSDGSRHSRWGRWHQEETCMKINLPIFKDEDAKDAVTYQSWRWDLTVYQHAGCRDCTLLPYTIRSLQGYTGELVWSSRTDITLDNVLTILDEHYNNVKVLDVLNQELFQLWMTDKETVLDWGIHLSRHLQILAASFPDHFPPGRVAELKRDHFYGGLPKQLKAMAACLKVGPQMRTYLDYLRATREAEKEDSIELPQSSRFQSTHGPSRPRITSFFLLRKLKGNQPLSKTPTVWLTQLEEEDADDSEDPESNDPSGIKGVTEEFMIWLARVVKDAQADEKHCYHCNIPQHFIHNCPLMKTARDKKQLNGKGGGNYEGSLGPSNNNKHHKEPPEGGSGGIETTSQTPFLNLDPFQQ